MHTRWSRALVIVALASAGIAASPGDGSLVAAVKARDWPAVNALLRRHADVNAPEGDGTTALHWAAHWDAPQIVDQLIAAGANVNARNEYGATVLSVACTNGNAAIVEKLVRAGADLEARTSGETAVMTAVRTGSLDAVRVLLAAGASRNAKDLRTEQTLLMTAAAEAHPEVVKLLIEHGVDAGTRSKGGFTALAFAVRSGSLPSVKLLLGTGGHANDTLPGGTTLLVMAVVNANYEIAEFLLSQGADPNADSDGRTALHALVQTMDWDGLGMPAPELTGEGRVDARDLLRTLLTAGANPNVRMTKGSYGYVYDSPVGATPFWMAARAADVPTMLLLATHGADPLVGTRQGTTPLMVAAGVGFLDGQTPGTEREALDAVRMTLDLGADINAAQGTGQDCTPANYSGIGGNGKVCGWTALHGAAARGSDAIVQLLVERGAALDVKDKAGQTPLNVAEFSSLTPTAYVRESTAQLLRKLMNDRKLAQR
jgi:ankyrin repeat protein